MARLILILIFLTGCKGYVASNDLGSSKSAAIPSPTPSPGPSPAPSPSPAPMPIPNPTPTPMPSPSPNPSPDCTVTLEDGIYSQNLSSSYSSGAIVCARNDGRVTFQGGQWNAGNNLTFRGIRIVGGQKELGNNNTYERVSFVGGDCGGNTVNTAAGEGTANVVIRNSAFYGQGGRYLFLSWRSNNVTLENVIFRADGGCANFGGEPTATLNFYDSDNATCDGCVDFDDNQTANEEHLGGLGANCHQSHDGMEFKNSIAFNADRFYSDGMGSCGQIRVNNSFHKASTRFPYSITRGPQIDGSTIATNFRGTGKCGNFSGTLTLVNSSVGSNNGCSGSTNGTGTTVSNIYSTKPTLREHLNDPRWRTEMCQGVTRGWCGTNLSLSDYISQ